MAVYVLDTSALVRRYDAAEPGSVRVRSLCRAASGNTIVLSRVAPLELASALARKSREGTLDDRRRSDAWRLFLAHWKRRYRVLALDEESLVEAQRLIFTYPLRAYDAVHVACALRVSRLLEPTAQRPTFLTADRAQARAAEAEGLPVERLGEA